MSSVGEKEGKNPLNRKANAPLLSTRFYLKFGGGLMDSGFCRYYEIYKYYEVSSLANQYNA
jgi:hypothetical protein